MLGFSAVTLTTPLSKNQTSLESVCPNFRNVGLRLTLKWKQVCQSKNTAWDKSINNQDSQNYVVIIRWSKLRATELSFELTIKFHFSKCFSIGEPPLKNQVTTTQLRAGKQHFTAGLCLDVRNKTLPPFSNNDEFKICAKAKQKGPPAEKSQNVWVLFGMRWCFFASPTEGLEGWF